MQRWWMAMGLLAALALAGAEYPVRRLTPYPKEFQSCYQGTRFRHDGGGTKTPCLYGSLRLPEGTAAVTLVLAYRCSEGTSLKFGMNFRTQNGGNGSAGRVPARELPMHRDFATATLTYEVPSSAVGAQFTIGIAGKPSEFEIQSLKYEVIPDRVALARRAVSGKPSSWRGAAELRHFYIAAGGGAANAQTRVRVAFDDANLYVGTICDEPAMDFLKASVKERDGALWRDDDVELFLFDPDRNVGWQFIVNAANVQFDAALKQAQAGDPYRADKRWDGEWRSETWRNSDSWEAAMVIPWRTLGFAAPPEVLTMNFTRKRIGGNEASQWNAFAGNLNDVPKFARASFGPKPEIVRYRKLETAGFVPKRARQAGAELLSSEAGGYVVVAGRHHYYQSDYPAALQAQFTPERQREILERHAKLGSWGPKLPWAPLRGRVAGGMKELLRLNQEFGMVFEYAIYNSSVSRAAIRKYRCPLFCGNFVEYGTPEYLKATLDQVEAVRRFCAVPGQRALVGCVEGADEPTNQMRLIYNRKENPGIAAALDEVDARVKRETGFGKYGLHDFGGTPDADTPFRRIAFWRYWNNRFAEYLKAVAAAVRAVDPTLPFQGFNRNTCGGVCEVDLAQMTPLTQEIGCDPYPTSAKSSAGMGRAIYHTGFSVKLLHDLACRSRTRATLQGFIYHGGRPTPAEMREWASQALKNGAVHFRWYESGPAKITMPDGYAELERLCGELHSLRRLPLPRETKSAILYSDYDRWGLDDRVAHAAYTVYALLGEHVKANFRFVSPTGLANGVHTLDGIAVLYVPRMRYTDPATTARILAFVRGGGRLVVFDPTVWSWNIDGTAVPERALLTGAVKERTAISTPLAYGKAELPLAAAANLGRETGKVDAFDFTEAETAVVARYPDGRPAAVERRLGQGTVLFFAAQPFGCSDAALDPQGWTAFFQDECRRVGEKTDLAVWDFVLPGNRQ